MRKVEVTTNITVKPESILEAFLDEKSLGAWWGVEKSLIERKKHGVYTLAWRIQDKGIGYVSTGNIANYIPGKYLEIDNFIYLNPATPIFGPMKLLVKVDKLDTTSELYLCQDGYQNGKDWDQHYEACAEAWPAVLKSLKNFLEKKQSGAAS
jgi:hypothetical protein